MVRTCLIKYLPSFKLEQRELLFIISTYTGWKIEDKVHLGEELSDVLIYLVRLSDRCHVNLPAAVIRKFELNTQRYPTGKDSGVIGIAKMGQEET